MKKLVLTLLFFGFLLNTQAVFGQQDPQFSQFMFNQLFYNPGYTGVEGITKFTAIHRSQWAGYNPTVGQGGAPTTQVFSLSAPVFKINSGVGFFAANDMLGPLNNLQAQVSYAYHLPIKETKLSFGIRGGVFSQTINFTEYRLIHPDDPAVADGKESQIRPDLALGFHLQHEKFYVGMSFNHLIKGEFNFGNDKYRNALENHAYITAGYDYEFNYNLTITPTFLVKTDFNEYSFDLGVIGTFKNKMWGGLSFRQAESASVILGYSLFKDNSLKLGYGFDYVISAQAAKQATSHEILLSYQLPVSADVGKKVVRTPRFRH